MRPNVHIITDRVTGLSNEGIITTKDTTKPDVLIYATGFEAGDLLAPLTHKIRGKNGITLKDKWNGTPKAYKGMTVPDFPNFLMLYGPNTNLGHNSIIFMMETQVDYFIKMVNHMLVGYNETFDTNE